MGKILAICVDCLEYDVGLVIQILRLALCFFFYFLSKIKGNNGLRKACTTGDSGDKLALTERLSLVLYKNNPAKLLDLQASVWRYATS